MTIKLYTTKSLPNVVSKTLGTAVTVTDTNLMGEYDERNPVIRVRGVSNIDQYNYFELDGKYYFMSTTKQSGSDVAIIEGQIDVLMSFPSVVGDLTVYIDRGPTAEPYVADDKDTLYAYQNQDEIIFSTGFSDDVNDGLYILMTAQNGYKTV